jgi:hypothetical protein
MVGGMADQTHDDGPAIKEVVSEALARYAERFQYEFPFPPGTEELAKAALVAMIAVDVFQLMGAAERKADLDRIVRRNGPAEPVQLAPKYPIHRSALAVPSSADTSGAGR